MAYVVDFWVAAATVAPVIALSATVAISDIARQIARFEASLIPKAPSWRRARRLLTWSMLISSGNILLQSIIMSVSLFSLANSKNAKPPLAAAFFESLGLMLIFFSVLLNGMAGLEVSRAPEDQRKQLENTQSGIMPINHQLPWQGEDEEEKDDDGDM
jgi:hypothetical protein